MQCVQSWLGRGSKLLATTTLPSSPVKNNSHSDLRSMNEISEVAEKIILNLNAVFEKDSELDEFDIIPHESQSNRSPVIHHQHKLGIESWCIGFVYSHSFRNFIILRPQKSVQPKTSSDTIFHSTDLLRGNTLDHCHLTESEKWRKCLELTRLILLLNPDLTTAWNFRREAILNSHTSMREEFQLVTLVCSRKPKCSEAFYYRKWLVKETIKREGIGSDHSLNFFWAETKAAHRAASKYFSNYHAWDYRRFVVETWVLSDDVPVTMKAKIFDYEKETSDTWLNTHISDYCGYHYRQKLLTLILNFQLDLAKKKDLVQADLTENRTMILFYPGHESLWYHRKFLVKQYTVLLDNFQDDILSFLGQEYNLVEGILPPVSLNGEPVKNPVENDCLRLNHAYAERYFKWLKTTF